VCSEEEGFSNERGKVKLPKTISITNAGRMDVNECFFGFSDQQPAVREHCWKMRWMARVARFLQGKPSQ
jgi:hypothetical protein